VGSVAGFAVAAGLLTLIPGPDTLLTVRMAVTAGRPSALAAAAGICTALLGWGAAAGLGLTAALAAAPAAYLALRWAGAAYLCYLGVHSIVRGARWPAASAGSTAEPVRRWPGFLRGVLTCASNPKVGVFYLALFPQFIAPGERLLPASLALAAIHAAETLTWLSIIAVAGGRLGRVLRHRSARRWAERVSGAAFLAFAARLALLG
jgi:threonine/homoserine/homoserine lactone efflux protein